MSKKDDELITQSDAARLTGKSLAAINMLVQRGTLRHVEKFGRRLVYRSEVEKLKQAAKGKAKTK